MAFGFNASNNTMNGGAGNVNAGPDLETIQTEVSSSNIFFAWLYDALQSSFFFLCCLSVEWATKNDNQTIDTQIFFAYRLSASWPLLAMPKFASLLPGSRFLLLHPRS